MTHTDSLIGLEAELLNHNIFTHLMTRFFQNLALYLFNKQTNKMTRDFLKASDSLARLGTGLCCLVVFIQDMHFLLANDGNRSEICLNASMQVGPELGLQQVDWFQRCLCSKNLTPYRASIATRVCASGTTRPLVSLSITFARCRDLKHANLREILPSPVGRQLDLSIDLEP